MTALETSNNRNNNHADRQFLKRQKCFTACIRCKPKTCTNYTVYITYWRIINEQTIEKKKKPQKKTTKSGNVPLNKING